MSREENVAKFCATFNAIKFFQRFFLFDFFQPETLKTTKTLQWGLNKFLSAET